MDNIELKSIISKILEDKKAKDINIIDVRDVTTVTDFFVICSGESDSHVKALSEYVAVEVKDKYELSPLRNETMRNGCWSVIDYGGIIVHVFNEETRSRYSLDMYWESRKEEKKDN